MEKILLPVLTAAVLGWLYSKKKLQKKWFVLLLAAAAFASVLLIGEIQSGERQKITAIDRTSEAAAGEMVTLDAQTADGEMHPVTIRIPERGLSGQEAEEQFDAVIRELDRVIPGKNRTLAHVEWNLVLPTEFEDSPVTAEWSSDRQDLLGWDGILGADIPAEGAAVQLTAILRLEDREKEYRRTVRVYPSKEASTLEQKLQQETDAMNAATGSSAEKVRLPEQVNGQPVTWYMQTEKTGSWLLLLILAGAFLSVWSGRKRQEEEEKKRKENLKKEYPTLVSRLQLLTAAGLSIRRSLKRLAKEYPEIDRCCYEMESGVTEQDALAHYGERCGIPEYKKLALLLAQSQKKGGQQLSMLLEQETQAAFETRRRSAREEGEKAAVKLILPMGMMLVVVLVIIMVPALMSF